MRRAKYSLLQSFSFAFQGIFFAVGSERNLRIHLAVALYVAYFSRYYGLTPVEYALLALVIGLVITCELFNTAIEKTVDMESPAFNVLAKIAKDVAAGAVLVSSITSIAVSAFLLWNPAIIAVILSDILRYFYLWIPVLAVTLFWVFWPVPPKKRADVKNRKKFPK